MASPIVLDFGETSCMVCLEEFSSARKLPIVILSCGHRIHFSCAMKLRTKICPTCRADLNFNIENDEKKSNEIQPAIQFNNLQIDLYHVNRIIEFSYEFDIERYMEDEGYRFENQQRMVPIITDVAGIDLEHIQIDWGYLCFRPTLDHWWVEL